MIQLRPLDTSPPPAFDPHEAVQHGAPQSHRAVGPAPDTNGTVEPHTLLESGGSGYGMIWGVPENGGAPFFPSH